MDVKMTKVGAWTPVDDSDDSNEDNGDDNAAAEYDDDPLTNVSGNSHKIIGKGKIMNRWTNMKLKLKEWTKRKTIRLL